MKILRYLLVASCLAFVAADAALAQDSLRTRLVGTWREFFPTDNLVKFDQDGAWKLYLQKGEIGDLRSLDGTWNVGDDGMLTIVIVMGTRSRTMLVRLSFEGEEMVVTTDKGERTRHRRHAGPIPPQYEW